MAASWSELGRVHIWNLTEPLLAVDDKEAMVRYKSGAVPVPLFTFSGHQAEGFGMDWCPTMPGEKSSQIRWLHSLRISRDSLNV